MASADLDSNGFYRTVSFDFSPESNELHLRGPSFVPGNEKAVTANQPEGWGLVGSAAMCSWDASIRAQGSGAYAVGNELWFLSLESCTSREATDRVKLTSSCM